MEGCLIQTIERLYLKMILVFFRHSVAGQSSPKKSQISFVNPQNSSNHGSLLLDMPPAEPATSQDAVSRE